MNDFTKIKLINNLIDLVDYFYENKRKKGSASQIKYLKGFSEGIAHALVELDVIDATEAKRILKGIGKRRDPISEIDIASPTESDENRTQSVKMSVPKNTQDSTETLQKSEKEESVVSPESLDVPTIFRQNGGKKSL